MGVHDGEVWFTEPSHSAPFIMLVDKDNFLNMEERLLCLHFDIELEPLVIVEQDEFDDDMVLMRTILQRPHTCIPRWSYRVTSRYSKVLSIVGLVSVSEQSIVRP